jgi:hypothetical protein
MDYIYLVISSVEVMFLQNLNSMFHIPLNAGGSQKNSMFTVHEAPLICYEAKKKGFKLRKNTIENKHTS